MSQYVAGTGESRPIERFEQLVEFFEAAAKPREAWRIGTEYEKVAVRVADGQAAPFSGRHGIEALLRGLAERYAWEPVEEAGRVVALRDARAAITLEPGGQLELSGEVCDGVHCAEAELTRHIDEITTVGAELGLTFLGLGMQPVSRLEEIEWVPKARYRIMAPYMEKVGTLGQRMMKQTAGVQVNFDYGDEADAMHKMRVAMGLVPLFGAMFANSPLSDGDLNRFLSYRGHVWTQTDPGRCGLLRFVFRDAASFEDYARYALAAPMYFIVRDGRWYDMTHTTFGAFAEAGHDGHRATLDDWSAHLTTLFAEVRLKTYLEIRCVDSQAPELMLAVPALVKGIFYDSDCLLAAWDLVKGWSWEQRLEAYHQSHRLGPRARAGRHQLADLASELVQIAVAGLEKHDLRNAAGQDESIYLEHLVDLVQRRRCPADDVIDHWLGPWNQDVNRLVAGSAYRRAA